MKNTTKILALVLVVMTVLMSLTIVAGAEESESTATTQTVTMTFESKDLPLVQENEKADGDSIQAGTDNFFTIVYRTSSKVEDSKATWGTEADENYYTSTRRLSLAAGTPKKRGYIAFTTEHANATVKVWWVSNAKVNKIDKDGEELTTVASFGSDATKNEAYYDEVTLVDAGTYYFYSAGGTNYIYKIEVSWEVETTPEPEAPAPHVNELKVGETTDIVIDDTYPPNSLGYYVSVVPFVVTEPGNYAFTSEDGIALIYDGEVNNLCGYTGKANLEPGVYYVWISPKLPGVTGTVHVTTTKTSWLYNLKVGENSVTIDAAHGAIPNDAGYPTTYAYFTVTEAAHYKFVAENVTILIFDATLTTMYGGWSGESDLEAGTYIVCLAFNDKSEGTCNVTVTQTAITPPEGGEGEEGGEEEPPVVTEDPKFSLGDNAVVIDGSQTNLASKAIAWYTFTPEVAGTYTFACSDLTVYILTQKDMSKIDYYIGAGGVADLEAGKTYYILVGKDGVKGEFTVNVSVGGEVGHKNTFVVGDNHYIITDALAEVGYEFITIEIAQPGTYVITGGAPMKVYMWTILGAMDNKNFGWNVDTEYASGFAPAFAVTLPEAGTYYIGTNYEFVGDLREFDINISLHTEHSFNEEGECICGEKAPEVPELTIWQKIVLFIKKIIFRLLALLPKRG